MGGLETPRQLIMRATLHSLNPLTSMQYAHCHDTTGSQTHSSFVMKGGIPQIISREGVVGLTLINNYVHDPSYLPPLTNNLVAEWDGSWTHGRELS